VIRWRPLVVMSSPSGFGSNHLFEELRGKPFERSLRLLPRTGRGPENEPCASLSAVETESTWASYLPQDGRVLSRKITALSEVA
jgi:hypothetical protein